jgi:4-hydroxy-3-methylbut-2-en-1-yl diphosphate reductase
LAENWKNVFKIIIAWEAGFCFGVEKAIDMVQRARDKYPEKSIDILNEIVHNKHVIQSFEKQDVWSVKSASESRGDLFVISAHGVSPSVVEDAKSRGLDVLDATCPLVTKIHRTVGDLVSRGFEVVFLGDGGHDETEGVMGVAPESIHLIRHLKDIDQLPLKWEKVALVSQTTQSVADFSKVEDGLRQRYPDLEVYNTICNATEMRQEALHDLAKQCDTVYVVGSKNSANAARLRDIAAEHGIPAFLIENASEIKVEDLVENLSIGVSAGASTPDVLINEVIERLKELGGVLQENEKKI